ncbi:PadR family transcriptional regulator [Leptospira gomenensis]|uniref:PadR family transcriptional regulator n=1 Tax=Leptospira gomenensis TaxID=2484974 RepID=A0A5F1YMC9_9LEPT|nr:PadR family transcriptional regulator [Leptospira gomenensis]TGK33291.1 PadR family transcriptional regulator [Leptospira gomenensis]TGK45116.1 PadR family transcriptional regulator [Leptospira gomenensis]TGK50901.1 PadR family transcriptional regulator [Leptospira gomenensis]TGK56524.1 PadR family transcriptional regulator [Leptospira gomenensis]
MSKKGDAPEQKSITPAMFHILLALAEEPSHGYAIAKSLYDSSSGSFKLGPGTLYRTLEQLRSWAWIRYSKRKAAEGDDPRRLYYEITATGKKVLVSELKKLESALIKAKSLDLLKNEK